MTASQRKPICALILTLVVVAAGIGSAVNALADTVYLKRGGSIEGEVLEGESTVEVRMSDGATTFNREDVLRIEKNAAGLQHASKLGSVKEFKSTAAKTLSNFKRQADKSLQDVKNKTAGWMQPIGKSKSTTAKEKALNASMNEMQQNLKKLHARDQAIAKEKRALKKDGLSIS